MLMGFTLFFSFVVEFGAIGVVILSQDEVIAEKQSGTAAWILSKPVSRVAFILAKLVAGTIGVLVFIVSLPALVAYVEISLAVGQAPALLPYLAALGAVALGLIFYLSLTIMLGVLFDSRVPVIGIALGVFFGSTLLVEFSPEAALILPTGIRNTATALAYGQALSTDDVVMLLVTMVWSLVFSGIALWRFRVQEL
jgi:ABC-2 type transport system permease protein